MADNSERSMCEVFKITADDLRKLVRGESLRLDMPPTELLAIELAPIDPYTLGIIVGEGLRDNERIEEATNRLRRGTGNLATPGDACCENENRSFQGGCLSCGAPCR